MSSEKREDSADVVVGPVRKRRRKNKKRLTTNTRLDATSHVEISNEELLDSIDPSLLTLARTAALCVDTPRIYEMLLYRIFCNPTHQNLVFNLWDVNVLVFHPEKNVGAATDQIVCRLMTGAFYPVLENNGSGRYFHPFGFVPEHKRYMLPREGFDAFISECFSVLMSKCEGDLYQDPVTNAVSLHHRFVMEGATKIWENIRMFLCVFYLARFVEKSPLHLKKRMSKQLAECAIVNGHPRLAAVMKEVWRIDMNKYRQAFFNKIK